MMLRTIFLLAFCFVVSFTSTQAGFYSAFSGVQYDWVDLRQYGNATLLNATAFGSDNCLASNWTNLGFTFPFYGKNYSQVRISDDGILQFTYPGPCSAISATLTDKCTSAYDNSFEDGVQFFFAALNLYSLSTPPGSNLVLYNSFSSCPYPPEGANPCWILMYYQVSWLRNDNQYGMGPTVEIILSGNGDIIVQVQSTGDPNQWTGAIARVQGIAGVDIFSPIIANYSTIYPGLVEGATPAAECPWSTAGSGGAASWPTSPSSFVFLPNGNQFPCPPGQYSNENSTGCLCYDSSCSDLCPEDPNKNSPGACGCGVSEVDTDTDGTPDCQDGCPNDILKTEPGFCGCGSEEIITNTDSIWCTSWGAASSLSPSPLAYFF